MLFPERAFVVCLLLLAAALRLIGVAHGQPPAALYPTAAAARALPAAAAIHPDEFLYISTPLRMAVTGDLNQKFFENPSFSINLHYLVWLLTGVSDGRTAEGWSARGIGDRAIASFDLYVVGRTFSALGGLVAVAAVYAAARRLTGRHGALSAGLVMAVAFPLVQHAHYATTSSLAVGFGAVGIWACAMSITSARPLRWFVVAGIAVGLAAGCRYNAAGLALINGWIALTLLRRGTPIAGVALGLAAIPAAFVFTTPFVLIDPAEVWADFRYITGQYGAGESLFSTAYGLAYELRYLGLFAVGLPACALAVVGALRMLAGRAGAGRALWIALAVFAAAYTVVVLRTTRPAHADQLLIPIIPVMALFAGAGAGLAMARLRRPLVRAALMVAVIALPLAVTLQFIRHITQTDTRYRAAAWMVEALPRGSRVHLNGPYNVALDPAHFTVTQNFGGQYPTLDEVLASGVDYVVLSDAWAFDLARQRGIIGEEALSQLEAYLDSWTTDPRLTPIARIARPRWPGESEPPNAAPIWHHPGLTVYRVN